MPSITRPHGHILELLWHISGREEPAQSQGEDRGGGEVVGWSDGGGEVERA